VSRPLREIVDALARAGALIDAPPADALPQITGLTADARRLARGMLFCAVRGAVLDGHQFVAEAAGRGAAAALVESRQSDVAIPQILVRNGRRLQTSEGVGEASLTRPEATVTDPGSLVVICDRLFEPTIGAACGGPAEAAFVPGGIGEPIDRFDASPARVISVYRVDGP